MSRNYDYEDYVKDLVEFNFYKKWLREEQITVLKLLNLAISKLKEGRDRDEIIEEIKSIVAYYAPILE